MQAAAHNWPVYGHDWAVEYLRKGMLHGRIRHAYLITGPRSIGKNTLAHAFAMALQCTESGAPTLFDSNPDLTQPCGHCRSCRLISSGNHPDMLYAENDPVSGALKIDAIRAVTRLIALKPYDSRFRIAIFRDFDRTQPRAQDALLKTLEEASPHAILILLADSVEKILPTIISRCQVIRLRPPSTEVVGAALEKMGADPEQSSLLARLSGGRIGWAIQALQDPEQLEQRTQALNLLDEALRGGRARRFAIAEGLDRDSRADKQSLRLLLELWLSYWRDVLLRTLDNPVKPSNIDRYVEIQQIVQRINPQAAQQALRATQRTLNLLDTNANVRLALEILFLDYPL